MKTMLVYLYAFLNVCLLNLLPTYPCPYILVNLHNKEKNNYNNLMGNIITVILMPKFL